MLTPTPRIALGLQSKLAVAFLLILLPILALAVYDYSDDYQRQQEAVLAGQLRTSQALGAMLDSTFDEAAAVSQAFVVDPIVLTFDPVRIDPYLRQYLPMYPQFDSLNVFDAEGRNVGTAGSIPNAEPRPSIADREHFQRAMATGRPALSGVVIARTTGRPSAAVVVPIKDQAGRPIGLVGIVLDLDALREKLRGVSLGPEQAIYVTDHSGTLAFHTLMPELTWEERDVSSYLPVRQALESGQYTGSQEESPVGGRRLVAAARTPKYEWVAGVSVLESTALEPLRRRSLAEMAAYMGATLLAATLGLAFAFAVTRPLQDITRAIAAFGRGDLGERARVRTGDELETTAEAFNRMAEALQREQSRLQEEQLRLRTILDTAPVGVVVAEAPTGRIAMLNRAGEVILGRPLRADLRVEQWQREYGLFRPNREPYPSEETPLARSLLRGDVVFGEEMVIRRPSLGDVCILTHSAPLRNEAGLIVGAVAAFQDITHIRELERAREEFISVVAHDLRSPITVIAGYAGLLRDLPPDRRGREQYRRAVEGILSSTHRLEKMVGDLLDASRIEARRLTLTREPVDLAKLVREVVDRAAAITSGHPVKLQMRGGRLSVEADPGRLEQVLANLLSNAAKYSYPETEILVEAEPRPGEVMVSVTNQGPGIRPEDREAIFSRFHRAPGAAAGKVPGLGLGLYITRGLVEAHGGRIWVESEEGKTATFRFTLPAKAEGALGPELQTRRV